MISNPPFPRLSNLNARLTWTNVSDCTASDILIETTPYPGYDARPIQSL